MCTNCYLVFRDFLWRQPPEKGIDHSVLCPPIPPLPTPKDVNKLLGVSGLTPKDVYKVLGVSGPTPKDVYKLLGVSGPTPKDVYTLLGA